MLSGNLPVMLPEQVQYKLLQYLKAAKDMQWKIYNLRENFRVIDLAYQREQDLTEEHQRAKRANRYGDSSKFQNITVPIVMPQVEAAVTYQSAVFLTGTPLFPVLAD